MLWREKSKRDPNDPYAWTRAHRTLSGHELLHLPSIADIMRDDHKFIVIQKAAQTGATEMAINLALWAADTGYADRGNVFFVMPTQNQMDDFAQARVDRAIEESGYLRRRLQPEPPRRKGADRLRLKRFPKGAIYMRGADSQRQLASVAADIVILDEFDQMNEGVLELARKRIASSRCGRLFILSTPRYPEAGINELFRQSDQRRYLLPCPSCALEQVLSWEENVDLERALVVCHSCEAPMDVLAQGRWEATAPGNERVHGYHLSRLYSPWANIREMIEASEATTPFAVQEFQNSDLGEPFVPPGGSTSIDEIDRCRAEYDLDEYAGEPCFMGVDVGLKLHVIVREVIDRPDIGGGRYGEAPSGRLWFAAEVDSFEELHGLLERFNVEYCLIDALPDQHSARQFSLHYRRRVWLAQYGRQQPGHERKKGSHREPDRYVINRTEALDALYQRFNDGSAILPRKARRLGGRVKAGIGEYYREVLVPKRTLERDHEGNLAARWVDAGKDDHYAHAELYCMLAAEIKGSNGRSGCIELVGTSAATRAGI